ncbi:MAG: ABC transporter ATP-binding protein [Zetaproteobacteria bacterium]|nr:ABC transporter ATP-binding protein [Pseudobdellovibrionaceae bacterium]
MQLRFESCIRFPKTSTRNQPNTIDLTCNSGIHTLLGPTGAGKTWLLRLVAGLEKAASGRLWLNEQDITQVPVRRRPVALVFQDFINYPHVNVFENIAIPLRIKKKYSKKEITKRVHEMADFFQLKPFLNVYPSELSGGQQQRTAFARALAQDADILLMDEPLVNLDYQLRDHLCHFLRDYFKENNKIALFATSDPHECLSLQGETIIMDHGQVLQQDSTVEVATKPKSLRVAEIISDPPMNHILGTKTQNELKLKMGISIPIPKHLQDIPEGDYQFGIRPENLHVDQKGLPLSEGKVTWVEVSGESTLTEVSTEGLSVLVSRDGAHNTHMGDQVALSMSTDLLYAFHQQGHLIASPPHREHQWQR